MEYWENFASHAFENTTQSVYAHCVLLRPSGVPVPCTFCFSIRRDMFDLPSLVIGKSFPVMFVFRAPGSLTLRVALEQDNGSRCYSNSASHQPPRYTRR